MLDADENCWDYIDPEEELNGLLYIYNSLGTRELNNI